VDLLVSLFVIRNFRGTCSSVEMLKAYMARKRLGTPVLELHAFVVKHVAVSMRIRYYVVGCDGD